MSSKGLPSRLLALPAELRDYVFELAFAPDAASQVNLVETIGPGKELLLTNRQVHREASRFCHKTRAEVWATTQFYIENCKTNEDAKVPVRTKEAINALDDAAVRSISHITLNSPKLSFTFTNGVWRCIGLCINGRAGGQRRRGVPRSGHELHRR